MGKIFDLMVIITVLTLNLAFISTYEVNRASADIYTYIMLPAVLSGVLLSLYSQDIKKMLIMKLLIISLIVVILSLLLSLPTFIGIIPSDLINPFIFLSVKKL